MSPTPGASLHNVAMLDFYIRRGDREAQAAWDAALGNGGGEEGATNAFGR